MATGFVAPMTTQRGVVGIGNPLMLVDNRTGTRTIYISVIKISGSPGVGEIVVGIIRGSPTITTITQSSIISAVSERCGDGGIDTQGAVFYQWNGVGTGIAGVSAGDILDMAVLGIGASFVELGNGIVIPAGQSLAILTPGIGAGVQVVASIHGRVN